MDKKFIYLDHAATTAARPEVVEAMLPYFTEQFGNPSSVYGFAAGNKKAITDVRELIAKSLNVDEHEVVMAMECSSKLISLNEKFDEDDSHSQSVMDTIELDDCLHEPIDYIMLKD